MDLEIQSVLTKPAHTCPAQGKTLLLSAMTGNHLRERGSKGTVQGHSEEWLVLSSKAAESVTRLQKQLAGVGGGGVDNWRFG